MAYVIDLSDHQIALLSQLCSNEIDHLNYSLRDLDPELLPGNCSYIKHKMVLYSDILSAIDESFKYVEDLPSPD